MAEVTHTSEMMYGLERSKGHGPKIWAGIIDVADAETLDTGMDVIYGCAFTPVEATDIDGSSPVIFVDSISAGVITFQSAEHRGTYIDATATVAYGIVVGRKN